MLTAWELSLLIIHILEALNHGIHAGTGLFSLGHELVAFRNQVRLALAQGLVFATESFDGRNQLIHTILEFLDIQRSLRPVVLLHLLINIEVRGDPVNGLYRDYGHDIIIHCVPT